MKNILIALFILIGILLVAQSNKEISLFSLSDFYEPYVYATYYDSFENMKVDSVVLKSPDSRFAIYKDGRVVFNDSLIYCDTIFSDFYFTVMDSTLLSHK